MSKPNGFEDALFQSLWESDALWRFHNPKRQEAEARFRRMAEAQATRLRELGYRVSEEAATDLDWEQAAYFLRNHLDLGGILDGRALRVIVEEMRS